MSSETTPLLAGSAPPAEQVDLKTTKQGGLFSAKSRVLFTSFLLSLAFRYVVSNLRGSGRMS